MPTDTEELNRILLKLEKIDQDSTGLTAQLAELNTEVKLIRQEMTTMNERSRENYKILHDPENNLPSQFALFKKDIEDLTNQFEEHISQHKEKEKKTWDVIRPIIISASISIGAFFISLFVLYHRLEPYLNEIVKHVQP